MSYYIDIIDQEKDENRFVLEKSSSGGIILAWNGGDKKDELAVVGTSLEFDIAHSELVDAKFIGFFTGNEIRFKVELRNQSDDVLLWSGHLVPDRYSEPYTNSVTFVSITAVCGLGRLKGKYLPESYYRDEKSVIDIICACLKLTSMELNVFFNPAIENSKQKDWNQIYIDTKSFYTDEKKTKKRDAYVVLEQLMKDIMCVCFQADNRWNIEGLNKRNIRSYLANLYDMNGVLLTQIDGVKLLKRIKALARPDITMIPPYNMISVSHERIPQAFPETIGIEKNEGWSVMPGVKGEVYSTDWNGNDDFYSVAVFPNYANSILKDYYVPPPPLGGIPIVAPFDENKFINLKNKIYLYKFQKVTISATFSILKWSKNMEASDLNAYVNPLLYQFLLNDQVVFSNRKVTIPENESLFFEDGKAELSFEWIVPEDGLLDVKFWRPSGSVYETNIVGFEITKLAIAPVNFEETYTVTDLISDEFTIDTEVELEYADDDSAFSKAFRLAKLNEATIDYNTILIPVLYGFSQNGYFYSVVDLKGANLIKDNINTVMYEDTLLENLEVIYNYMAATEMVVKTGFAITTGNFTVKVYKNNDVLGSRVSWMQWTDAVYKIETDRYQKTVCNIIRRMFNEASEKLDCVALNAVKFNDLILFKYVYDKQFVVTNCSWNLDENKTTLTLSRAIYRDSGDSGTDPTNVPPIVNAGVDIVLEDSQTSVVLSATAYDVDGFIVSQQWVKTLGGFGDIIISPTSLETVIKNLTEDEYQYKITVVDSDGATAFDTLNIIRRKDYEVTLELVFLENAEYMQARYKLKVNPNIPSDFNLIVKGRAYLFAYNTGNTQFKITKNGVDIYVHNSNYASYDDLPFSIGYISTDEIFFELFQSGGFPVINIGSSWIDLNSAEFVSGAGNILGVPYRYQPAKFIV
ncbi:hypothetical protein B0A75_04740 [Flavobacterium oncorhynchi]|uniref:Uncharacterized protein n=1 Tax=Flavobacterium oncorhynchi TaxID=728056 RepID=A0A226I7X6_9FLAO|nr:hypothetical protein [Flavobacterium oncorhynchi]OXB01752.1 hypothetical protein B0A75_04740 [Flavobacterium oncorhynchi]